MGFAASKVGNRLEKPGSSRVNWAFAFSQEQSIATTLDLPLAFLSRGRRMRDAIGFRTRETRGICLTLYSAFAKPNFASRAAVHL